MLHNLNYALTKEDLPQCDSWHGVWREIVSDCLLPWNSQSMKNVYQGMCRRLFTYKW